MIFNPGKCHYMLTSNHDKPEKINLNGTEITGSNKNKLLGVHIDKQLRFDVWTKFLYIKTEQKR